MDGAASNTACLEGNFKLRRKTHAGFDFPSQAVFTGRYTPLLRSSASRPANASFNAVIGIDEAIFFREKRSNVWVGRKAKLPRCKVALQRELTAQS